jgi:hypothetical protein
MYHSGEHWTQFCHLILELVKFKCILVPSEEDYEVQIKILTMSLKIDIVTKYWHCHVIDFKSNQCSNTMVDGYNQCLCPTRLDYNWISWLILGLVF